MVGAAGATVSIVTLMTADAALVVPDTVSVAVNLWSPSGKGSRGKAPGPACVRRRGAQQRRPVVDLHRAVRHRSAGQRQDRRIGNAVADNAGVGRERGDSGCCWRRAADGEIEDGSRT